MADGGSQGAFPFPRKALVSALREGEIVVDLFAGGGGASEALEQALGRPVDIAINHDPWAIGMHSVNHPFTTHACEDVFAADPVALVARRLVGWLHLSPDCTHFSQAKGGQPRKRAIRSLAWVAIKWIGMLAKLGLAPRVVSLENVRQMLGWCPLIAKRCQRTGRVVRLDGTVALPGERVPVGDQWLIPDPERLGETWRAFVQALRALGYAVEWKVLDASEYGADTDRKRLFMLARRDGEAVRWPAPTHGPRAVASLGQAAAANAIDWSVLGSSMFTRKRPLTRNTIRRTLDGAVRGGWPQPYIDALIALRDGHAPRLDITTEEAAEIARCFGHDQVGMVMATGGGGVARDVSRALPTITAGTGGLAPHFIRPIIVHRQNSVGGRAARPVTEPLPAIATRGAGHLVVPVLLGTQSTARAKPVSDPVPTITTGGAANAKRPGCARAQLIEPIIAPYYGSGSGTTGKPVSQPLPTIPTKGRFGLAEPVVVGYRIDILYRMLFERELFNAQGFRSDYVIDRTADGRRITRTQAIRMVGNSVSPHPLRELAIANLDPAPLAQRVAA